MRAWVPLLLLTAGLAGCIGTTTEPLERQATVPDEPTLDRPGVAVTWTGEAEERPLTGCSPAACKEHAFVVGPEAPDMHTVLTVAAKWSHLDAELSVSGADPSFQFALDGPDGPLGEATVSFLGAVLLVHDPAPGAYTATVWGTSTGGAFELGATLSLPAELPGHTELLPDLTTMPLSELAIAYPDGPPIGMILGPEVWGPPATALGVEGCGADEWAEEQVQRCLRFSNGVANVGVGPVEVRLPLDHAALNALGTPTFTQRILLADGTHRDVEAGPAEFHSVHGHYHFAGFAQTTLYHYDADTGTRGEVAAAGEKLGYCFIDVGILAVDHAPVHEPRYGINGCLLPVEEQAIVTGLQPGWFDLYWSDLSHQFIEITGLPDGVYELESIANVEGRIVEADPTNNAASVVIALTGDEVEVLGVPPAQGT